MASRTGCFIVKRVRHCCAAGRMTSRISLVAGIVLVVWLVGLSVQLQSAYAASKLQHAGLDVEAVLSARDTLLLARKAGPDGFRAVLERHDMLEDRDDEWQAFLDAMVIATVLNEFYYDDDSLKKHSDVVDVAYKKMWYSKKTAKTLPYSLKVLEILTCDLIGIVQSKPACLNLGTAKHSNLYNDGAEGRTPLSLMEWYRVFEASRREFGSGGSPALVTHYIPFQARFLHTGSLKGAIALFNRSSVNDIGEIVGLLYLAGSAPSTFFGNELDVLESAYEDRGSLRREELAKYVVKTQRHIESLEEFQESEFCELGFSGRDRAKSKCILRSGRDHYYCSLNGVLDEIVGVGEFLRSPDYVECRSALLTDLSQ